MGRHLEIAAKIENESGGSAVGTGELVVATILGGRCTFVDFRWVQKLDNGEARVRSTDGQFDLAKH